MEVCSHNQFDPNTVLLKINGTACNLCCHYCSEILKENKSHMSIDYIRDVFKKLPMDTSIVLHGGEPLLDAETVNKILELFKNNRQGRIYVQTNGYFGDDILHVLVKNKDYIKIGVSIDGPLEQSSYRVNKEGKSSFYVIDSLLDKLSKNNIEVKCIATIHKLNVGNPDLFLNYFLSKGNVSQLRINPCFDVTNNGLAPHAITPSQFYCFLEKIFVLWVKNSLFSRIRIDPIHAAIEQILSSKHSSVRNCSRFISIYPHNLCTLCDSLGSLSFTTEDWGNVFHQAATFAKNRLKDKCPSCSYASCCDWGCIAIMNRFQPWPELIDDYCQYRRSFYSLVNSSICCLADKK